MLSGLSKRIIFKKLISLIVVAQFIFTSLPIRAYALENNLRPTATKNSSHLVDIKNECTTGTRAEEIPSFQAAQEAITATIVAQEDPFRQVLGEYKVSRSVDNLPFGNYLKKVLEPSRSREKLEQIFGANLQTGEEYYALYFMGLPVALVKKDSQGKSSVKKVVDDLANIPLSQILEEPALSVAKERGLKTIDVVLNDYLYLEERASKPYVERMTLDWRELRDYKEKFDKGTAGFNISPLMLSGGKGFSLALMDGVVDVPPGFNVITTAYFKFVRENPDVFKIINEQLRALDTTDDQKRDVVSREIRETIKNAPIPQEIAREVLVMYRQLNLIRLLSGKRIPTAVAVRSSGTSEDIKVESWLPITTGSQAGQSDTFLNVKGEKNLLDKLRADWASLFTDRAVSYRDDAVFLIFSSSIGFGDKQPKQVYYDLLAKIREYAGKLNKPEFNAYADTLTNFRNPGSVNLMNAMSEILKHEDNPEIKNCLNLMRKAAEEFVNPEQLGIDVVTLQMVKSYLSGVIFTVNPATKMAGVAQALYRSWYMKDDSLVYKDEEGKVIGTKPIVVSFDISFGYGENVVGGKVNPDKFIMSTYDGLHWFIIEKYRGSKLIQMVDVEEAIDLLKGKISEENIRNLASMLGSAISYDEVGKRINGILATRLYGIRYLKELTDKKDESDKDKRARVQKIAEDIANMIKANRPRSNVEELIKQEFYIGGTRGLKESILGELIAEAIDSVARARAESEEGKRFLSNYFGNPERADNFILMFKEVLENKELDLVHRQEVLDKLNLTLTESHNLSYLMRSLIDKGFTCNLETTETHQGAFCITDQEATQVAQMAWNITTYYRDHRDIEFAIEIDPTAPENKRLYLYVIDKQGHVLTMTEKGEIVKAQKSIEELGNKGMVALRLFNVQARPYTAGYLKTDYFREGTEVDEKWLEEEGVKYGIKPIATGTKGSNATHAYVLVFDPNKTIDWHADEIRRLKGGLFSSQEREEIKRLGFNPDDYTLGSGMQLPIALYLLEADPSHDPIMRLANAVVTIRGGDTCHAAIFCREQGIPAVTGVGKVVLDGHLLKTTDGLTVDANNGRLYKLEADPKKRIPIIFVKLRIKPYGIPMDEDKFPVPSVGLIIAAGGSAQQSSPIMLAEDSAGSSLTRAEFKAEELGLNVFAGYGYDLIQEIASGKMQRPVRIYIEDIVNKKVSGAEVILKRINELIYKNFNQRPEVLVAFNEVFGREYKKEDGAKLLVAFDILRDIQAGTLNKKQFVLPENRLDFMEQIPKESFDLLSYAYGLLQRRFNYDYNIIEALENHPWILQEVEAKIKDKGYLTFKEYVGEEFYYFYNLMGFTISPEQKAKNRAYDFAQDKVRGMPGSEVFSWPGANPLVGLRGAALEIEGVDEEFEGNQKVLSFLLEAVIDADVNTHNQAWFYVFVRFVREMEVLDRVLGLIAQKKSKLPKQIGIMIEVPTDAMLAKKLAQSLLKMKEKYAKYGTQLVFFSFGTNDYSHLAGKGDREDPRMKLVLQDPAAIKAIAEMKQKGYFYNDATKQLPLIDEGADVMIQLMEAVVREANELDVETSLCGEAITSLVGRGDYISAGKIMGLLKSFGISMMTVRLLASMTRYDTMAATKEIIVPETKREALFDLSSGKINQKSGVIKGKIIYVEKADDLIPDALKGLQGAVLEEKREFLKMQSLESARSTMRTYDKIVVIAQNLVALREEETLETMSLELFNKFKQEGLIKQIAGGLYLWTNLDLTPDKFSTELKQKGYSSKEQEGILAVWQKAYNNTIAGLERRGINWDDLQYAKAIIVDSDINLEGWDVFRRDKGIVPTRIKAIVKGISSLRSQLEEQFVTIDYAAAKIYKGNLEVEKKKMTPQTLPILERAPEIETKEALREDANAAYSEIRYHPLLLLAYQQGKLGDLAKIFDEYVTRFIDEIDKAFKETNPKKRGSLLEGIKRKIEAEPEAVIREFLKGFVEKLSRDEKVSLPEGWLASLREEYFDRLNIDIARLLAGRTTGEFIKDAFKKQIAKVLAENKDRLVLHTTTSLNCVAFRNMLGGFLVEQTNPNPDYGLLGAARAIGDFWEINRLELAAFKEVRQAMEVNARKNFGLQITELRGTQSGAVLIAWRDILKDMGIIPGEDGLEIGVNIATPADTLALNKYFEYFDGFGRGLSFVTYNRMSLGAAWAGVDLSWNEWRRLAQEEELDEIGDIAINIIKGKIDLANKNDKARPKTIITFALPIAEVINRMQALDKRIFNHFNQGYSGFVDSLKGLKDTKAALVIGANTILDNPGSIAALTRLKEAQPGIKIAVWADNEVAVNKLKAMNVDKIADILSSRGLNATLDELNKAGIAKTQTALINSPKDLKNIKEIAGLLDINSEYKLINVKTPTAQEKEVGINAMSLVIARAVTGILQNEKLLVESYKELVKHYRENSQLSEIDADRLGNLSSQLSEVPLIKVSEEIAKAQLTYEEMVGKI